MDIGRLEVSAALSGLDAYQEHPGHLERDPLLQQGPMAQRGFSPLTVATGRDDILDKGVTTGHLHTRQEAIRVETLACV